MSRHLVFDISTLARSDGQAVGILRVVRELARWARVNSRNVAFVLYDPKLAVFREVSSDFLQPIIDGNAIVDYSTRPETKEPPAAQASTLPKSIAAFKLWLRNPRRRLIVALERLRINHGFMTTAVQWLQTKLLGAKHLKQLTDPSGARRALLPFDIAAGRSFELGSNHFFLCPGSDWMESAWSHVMKRKSETDLRICNICYDLIPFLFPHFYPPGASESFEKTLRHLTSDSDLVFVTASKVAEDMGEFCASNELHQPNIRIFRPGADLIADQMRGKVNLPAGLVAERYALFVSTIEPRKGHQLLFSVWKRLLEQGIPQEIGFKLVFVGRRGWLVDKMMAQFEADESYGSSLIVLSGVNDNELANIYSNAAFGLFPSLYEGYGLPVVELFQYGKAVLSSSAGALKEVVGPYSPCLDPLDEDAWYKAMSKWIKNPDERTQYETIIREQFAHPTWEEAAERFFDIVGSEMNLLEQSPRKSHA